jgi:CubicO group peptidase (beta-lactamase class C family)
MNTPLLSTFIFTSFLSAIPHADAANQPLPRSTPEAQGVSSQAISDFVEAADKINTLHSFMLLRHGRVIAEGWWKPEAADKPHVLHSLSKSFNATAVGLAIAEGKLSLDDPVLKFFPADAPAHPSDNLKAMTVRDLLTMTCGHETEPKALLGAPSVKQFLAHPVPHKPGTHFQYNTMGSYTLSAIVTKTTGQTSLEFLKPRLFEPLGIADTQWDKSPEGNSLGGYGLKLCTEDIAKFGQLYLQKGKWNGKQLIPEKWIERATSKQVPNDGESHANMGGDWRQGYGFQFWRCTHNAFRGDGASGQFCVVMPDKDAVIAITADTGNMQGELNAVWDKLLPAFQAEALPEDSAGEARLKQLIAHLMAHPAKKAIAAPPARTAPAGVAPAAGVAAAAAKTIAFPRDPAQSLERTCFQTGRPWSGSANLRSDVAICYGIDPGLPGRIETWRDQGYRIHVMTGVSWGSYQDYLYGRYDGVNHEDEAQTDQQGNKVGHGGDVYYMCPGINYGKYLCVGVQRALDAGAEAIHLEEPEFWVKSGYSEGFKREWHGYYGEDWQPPHGSVDAQWRSSKLKYFLYRRALQQVFDYIQDYNRRSGRKVRCYVPTHSLINYAQWKIVSPESSLARLNGCDGYIAQVWTGTSRTPNVYQGRLRQRTFETAFLEYGAMQNLVRATGRQVWYLNDPIEDNPNYDWQDYRTNWESTLVASLLQPDVSHYEVAPWPERIFNGRYPRNAGRARRRIPPAYATELQTVMNALNHMDQRQVDWHGGSTGYGFVVGDTLMFERGGPTPSDEHLGQVYGLALPLVKRGIPIAPVQLENVTAAEYLKGFRMLMLTYHGMKPQSPEVHAPLTDWVRRGGVLVIVDDDADPYNRAREWWNSNGLTYATPREHLFKELGLTDERFAAGGKPVNVGEGYVAWLREDPAALAASETGDARLVNCVKQAAALRSIPWREANNLLLRRGPYLIGAGLNESIAAEPKVLKGPFINLFDPELRFRPSVALEPGSRMFLLDLDAVGGRQPKLLAAACKALPLKQEKTTLSFAVEGVAGTPAVVLLRLEGDAPKAVTLAGQPVANVEYAKDDHLLWIRFENTATPRELELKF